MIAAPRGVAGLQDRALLLVGFASASGPCLWRVGAGLCHSLPAMTQNRRFFRALAPALAVLAAVWLVIYVPQWQGARADLHASSDPGRERALLINETRRTLIQLVGGLAVLAGAVSGAFFTWTQIRVNREGQFTDRFAKAITQLGDAKLAVRLGGIYAPRTVGERFREGSTRRDKAQSDAVSGSCVSVGLQFCPSQWATLWPHCEALCRPSSETDPMDHLSLTVVFGIGDSR